MGEAKRRGSREQRIAQAIERRKLEDARIQEQRERKEATNHVGEAICKLGRWIGSRSEGPLR